MTMTIIMIMLLLVLIIELDNSCVKYTGIAIEIRIFFNQLYVSS